MYASVQVMHSQRINVIKQKNITRNYSELVKYCIYYFSFNVTVAKIADT